MTDHWFKPKTRGYGASPANWKGWVAIGVFVVVDLIITWVFILRYTHMGSGPSGAEIVAWALTLGVAIAVFLWICAKKTDGKWRWRWGEK